MQLMKKYRKKAFGTLVISAALFIAPVAGLAEQNDSNAEIIKLLQEKNIITAEEADNILSRYQNEGVEKKPASMKPIADKPYTVVVPKGERYRQRITDEVARDIKEEVKKQVKSELKDEIAKEVRLEANTGSVPAWTKRIRFGGDMRLRYQGEFFDEDNSIVPDLHDDEGVLLNTREDRQVYPYRFRVGANAQVNNQAEVAFRLATGSSNNPVSTNDILGDALTKDTVTFDQAYLKWTPIPETSTWAGKFDLWGGRFPNPFYSSELVWDKDVNFEGIAVNFEYPFTPRFKALLNTGIFPLEEVELSSKDKWLYGAQVGVEYAPRTTLNYKLAAAYYNYSNIAGHPNDSSGTYDHTVPAFFQEGNTMFNINDNVEGASQKFALASDYALLNITSSLDLGFWDPVHVILQGDFVKNIGFDKEEIFNRTGTEALEEVTGYQAGLTLGYPNIQKLWDWQTYFSYRYLEADAVLDAFADSDFLFGGTNAKGWIFGGQLGVGNNLWINARWISADEASGPPVAIDKIQVDLNARF